MSLTERLICFTTRPVSLGSRIHIVGHALLVLMSLPTLVNWSPTCSTWRGWSPKYACSVRKPMYLLPTSTHASAPPLKAQNGGKWPPCASRTFRSSACTVRTTSSNCSRSNRLPPSDRMIPTASCFRTTCAGKLSSRHSVRSVVSATSSTVVAPSLHQRCAGVIHSSSGTSCRWQLWSQRNRKLDSPPSTSRRPHSSSVRPRSRIPRSSPPMRSSYRMGLPG
mmetsp:Transcript_12168/g.42188  ORF Transcript_12168/g.42188 Transcript_12168/m.42188 type:complete len:222 (-) Transcript_12168:955-1620(-)